MTTTIYSVDEARRRARRLLPKVVFDFIEGGADDELTTKANRRAFDRILFRPLTGVDVGEPDLRTTVLDTELSFPVLLAPCGGLSMFHPDGQAGAARAAASAHTIAVVGTLSGSLLEKGMSDGGGAPHWFQLYKLGGRAGAERLVDRASEAGYRTLVVSVDTPVVGHKERDIRNGGVRPGGTPAIDRVDLASMIRFAPKVAAHPRWVYRFARAGFPLGQPNVDMLQSDGSPISLEKATEAWMSSPATWADFEWIRSRWSGRVVAKGILSGDDARRAVGAGADAVIISNHGGRQLDAAPATINVLQDVVEAVGTTTEVLLDSGIRRGSDVARALALGARAVLIGRPYLYGLAVGGERGVRIVLDILRDELTRTLQLLGRQSVAELDRSSVLASGESAQRGCDNAQGSLGP